MYPRYMGGSFIHEQAKHLIGRGCEIRAIVPASYCPPVMMNEDRWRIYSNIPAMDTIDDVRVYYPRYFRLPGKWFHPLSCYTQALGISNIARGIISDFRPDIIHAHGATAAGFIGLILRNKYGIPLICSLRGSDINAYPGYGKLSMHLTKRVISESDCLVSVSAALKNAAESITKSKKEIYVLYNGCDNGMFSKNNEERRLIRQRLGIPEGDKVFVFVGSMSADKGIFELLEAFTQIKPGDYGLHLLLVGSGPEEAALAGIAASRGLTNRLHMAGDLPHHEIPKFMSAADIFVLPSHSEGLPNVVLEAMGCSLPVIGTRVGGIPEAVDDGESGILIEKKSVSSLVEAMKHLAVDDKLAGRMGALGRKIVESKFTWRHNSGRMFGIYRELMHAA